jgi:YfiH family protein
VVPRTITLPPLAAVPDLVHGFGQRAARAETREETRSRIASAPEADAAVAEEAGLLLGIKSADCLPILLVDPRRRAVAAAHAGWRGTAGGVSARAVEALVARGSRASDLLAALGPAIGPCCYEVGDELRDAFGDEADHVLRPGAGSRPHLDLRRANTRQLLRAGLAERSLFQLDECTRCHAERYHSYRRDGRGAGRMISFVGYRRG